MTRWRLDVDSLLGGGTDAADRVASGCSRREFLAGVGAVALLGQPTIRAIDGVATGWDVSWTRSTARIRVAGRDAFVLDAGRFAGTPRVSVARSSGLTRISLTGAQYPGTRIPADMTLTILGSGSTATATIVHALGFESRVRLLDWLRGTTLATGAIDMDGPLVSLPGGTGLDGHGRASVTFAPDLTLVCMGGGIATVRCDDDAVAADTFRVELLDRDDASVLKRPPARRCLVVIDRGEQAWDLRPRATTAGRGALEWASNPFDDLSLECGEARSGAIGALVARGATDSISAHYVVDDAFAPGSTARVPLAGLAWATYHDGTGTQAAIAAEHPAEGSWIHVGTVGLRLGGTADSPAFTAMGRGDLLSRVVCSPAVTGVTMPSSDDTIVSAAGSGSGARTTVVAMGTHAKPKGSGALSVAKLPLAGGGAPTAIARIPVPDIQVLRPADMCFVTLMFDNMVIEVSTLAPPVLRGDNPRAVCRLRVAFPPQSVGEEAFFTAAGEPLVVRPRPVMGALAGPSRLTFLLGDNPYIPFDLDHVLDWRRYRMDVAPAAWMSLTGPAAVEDPRSNEAEYTYIEMPYRLQVSPLGDPEANPGMTLPTWRNATQPRSFVSATPNPTFRMPWTELWHTRLERAWLTVRAIGGGTRRVYGPSPQMRALYTSDWPDDAHASPKVAKPFDNKETITPTQRRELVKLMGETRLEPADVDLLMLSSMGGWLTSRAAWASPQNAGVNLEAWDHRATMGRDHYVKIVERGFLYPFGHRASLVTLTERKFRPDPNDGQLTAYLLQRKYIVIRQPEISYVASASDPASTQRERMMPFSTVRIKTKATPDLWPDPDTDVIAAAGRAFWPKVRGGPFKFDMEGVDHAGRAHTFTAPLIFVPGLTAAWDAAAAGGLTNSIKMLALAMIRTEYGRADATGARLYSGVPLEGARVAFAPQQNTDDTTLVTNRIDFGGVHADITEAIPTDRPRFFPRMDQASAVIPAVGTLSGAGSLGTQVEYPAGYLTSGLGVGEVFLNVKGSGVGVGFTGDKSGGVATPDLTITGVSRRQGAIGGTPADFDAGTFDPSKYFGSAKILGGIPLSKIIGSTTLSASSSRELASAGTGAAPPKFQERIEESTVSGQLVRIGVVSLTWSTPVNQDYEVFSTDAGKSFLTLNVETRSNLSDPADSHVIVTGTLTNFSLDLVKPVASFLKVHFTGLRFTSIDGAAPTMDIVLAPSAFSSLDHPAMTLAPRSVLPSAASAFEFLGALGFLDQLKQYLKFGDDEGLSIELMADRIRARYGLSLPPIAFGAFSLTDAMLSVQLDLPFSDPVSLRFAFGERNRPFIVQVSFLGGGGFVAVTLDSKGMRELEASFEFGAQLSLDLGVASGSVYARGGIYFGLVKTATGHSMTFAAFLRIGGQVDVLGLISVSIEFYVELAYVTGPPKKLAGTAQLTVHVEVLFFEKDVVLTVYREFDANTSASILAGSTEQGALQAKAAPVTDTFPDIGAWTAYAASFAPTSR